MPSAPRRPQAHRHRQQLQARRLRAAELFAVGVHAAEVARQLGVSRQAASRWHAAWKAGGTNALASRGPTGPTPRLSDAQLVQVEQALRKGAVANGFAGELWAPPSRLGVGDPALPAGLDRPAPAAPRGRTRPGRHRPLGRRRLAQDQKTLGGAVR